MLKCRDVAERASAFADRELPWRERMAMRIHMAMCGPCRRYVSQMLQTIGLAAATRASAGPADGATDETAADALADRLARARRGETDGPAKG
jgi:anti-sigma factor ChrR (cupin superfamily)